MKRVFLAGIIPVTLTALVAIGWWLVQGAQFDVLQPSGDIAVQQTRILFFTLCLAAIVVIPVFYMLITFAWRFRASNKKADYRPDWNDNRMLEMIWWGVPIVIISVLAWITWQSSNQLDPYRPIESQNKTVNIQVVALQWKWLFIYEDYGIATVNNLPIPEKTPIHFKLTADAPMSAFWVPALGSQIYTMNGMESQLNLIADKTGVYRGYNTNINGEGYSSMTFTVEAKKPNSFEQWAKDAKNTAPPLSNAEYLKLATPGVNKNSMVYRSVNPDLFDNIIGKYMSGHGIDHDNDDTKMDQSKHVDIKDHSQMHDHGGAH